MGQSQLFFQNAGIVFASHSRTISSYIARETLSGSAFNILYVHPVGPPAEFSLAQRTACLYSSQVGHCFSLSARAPRRAMLLVEFQSSFGCFMAW